MGLQKQIATSHLETLIENITGVPKAQPEPDGTYLVRSRQAGFYVAVQGEDTPIFRLFTVIAAEIAASPELMQELNELNRHLLFLRATHVGDSIVIAGELMALTADPPDVVNIFEAIASASDYFGPMLIDKFGGRSPFEQTKEPGYSTPQPETPGYL